jgi:RHS repeat-associated protein
MTLEATDAVIAPNDSPVNPDVPGDSNYQQPEEPYVPEQPETGNDYEGPIGVTGIFNGNVTTACSYDPAGHSAHRVVEDIPPIPGSLGKYPLKLTRYYSSRLQYYAGGTIGLGPGWSHEYAWLLWSDGTRVVSPHGNVSDFFCGPPVGISDGWDDGNQGRHFGGAGTWRLADGGKVHFVFGRVDYIEDPYGLRTTIQYDGNGLRTQVTEPGGRYLKFIYDPNVTDPDGSRLLTRVEAHGLGNTTVTDWVNYNYTLVSAGVRGRDKMMLTRVDYSDSNPNDLNGNTHGHYTYRDDNVTETQNTHKMYPVLERCDDVRYTGPMRTIRYEYDNGGPHGAIINEKCPNVGAVSAIAPRIGDTFTETRGDGATRSFTYTHMMHCHGDECTPCDDYENNDAYPYRAPQQMLDHYTDFQDRTTQLHYNSHWYIDGVTDANGHTTSYQRGTPPTEGAIGQITRITHPDGTHIDYTYYPEPGALSGHYLQTVTNERGNVTAYNRDGNHRVTSIDYKNNQNEVLAREEFVYNGFGQVTRHKLKNGKYVHYQYDGRGLLTAKWNPTPNDTALPGDPKTSYAYYTGWCWADRVSVMTLPANGSGQVARETYEYDRNWNGVGCNGRGLVTKMTHADNKYQSFDYSQFGNKMWEENELRQRTAYTYDDYSRVLSVRNPLNKIETSDYLKPGTASAYLHTTNSVYTHTSRAGIVTTNVYDQNWRKTSTTEASGVLNLTTNFAYDNVGNLIDVTDPRSKITHNVYDNRNRKTSTTEAYTTTLAATTVWHYDPANNINRINRADGIEETKGYDALNRVIWHTIPRQVPGQNPIELTTRFYYNPSGTLWKVTDPKNRDTTFEYDFSDRRTRMWYLGDTESQRWTFDDAGNLQNRTTVRGGAEIQRFEYDNRNRKISMRWDNGVDSATYDYDDASRLTNANNANSIVTRIYDAAGRLTQDQQNVSGLGIKNVSYPLYDDDGKVRQISAAGVYDYTFGYDAAGRFETISAGGSTNFEYDYDAASNETHRYAYLSGVTIDQIYARDSLDRMASRVLKRNGQNISGSTEAYTYDHMNRLREVNRSGVADSFDYYWSGELLSAQYGGGAQIPYTEGQDPDLDTTDTADPNANYQPPETAEAEPTPPANDTSPPDLTANTTPSPDATPPSDTPPAEDPAKQQKTVEDYLGDGKLGPDGPQQPDLPGGRSVTYTLDKAGNRTSVTDNVNGNATYVPNNLNQYTSVGGSPVGNGGEHEIQTYNTVRYYYINDEHLKRVTSGSNDYYLYYDALGRCVKRVLNGSTTYYIYDGEKPILEYRSTDLSHPAKNLYGKGIDEILMRYDPSFIPPVTCYYQQDHEGSVTHLLNTSGNVIETYKYDAFGAPAIYDVANPPNQRSSSHYSNRFLFTGREYANLFGFYEYRARAYHPGLGRFMSEDPKLFEAGDYNLFRYCHNDPIDFTDPMGLEVGFGESLIPVWGSAHMAYDAYNEGHYGWAALHAAMALSDVIPAKAGLTALGKAGAKAFARKEVAAVLGKFTNSPNYLQVAEKIGAKKFDIPRHIWKKMTEAERWTANQKFLDRAIARGGDFVLDKPIKDIASVSGQLRKELDYLSRQRGFELSRDGSRMVRSTNFEAAIEKGTQEAQEHSSNLIHSKPDPNSP